jgi:hypothetical protein
MFRVTLKKTQVVAGSLHYHLVLWSFREGHWSACGVLILYEAEWVELLRICEGFHIEVVIGEALPTASA